MKMNRSQQSFLQAIATDDPAQRKARRMLMDEVRERWFHDLARLYPQAIGAIEAALAKSASPHTRTTTAKWLIEQRRAMVPEEREAEQAKREAEEAPGAGKAPSEMTLAELEASIARLSILAAAEQAEDAQIVPESSIFD